MTVHVELFGQLRNVSLNQDLEIRSPMPVSEVAGLLGIKAELIGLAVIDGRQVPLSAEVPEDCRLSLFSPMMGG